MTHWLVSCLVAVVQKDGSLVCWILRDPKQGTLTLHSTVNQRCLHIETVCQSVFCVLSCGLNTVDLLLFNGGKTPTPVVPWRAEIRYDEESRESRHALIFASSLQSEKYHWGLLLWPSLHLWGQRSWTLACAFWNGATGVRCWTDWQDDNYQEAEDYSGVDTFAFKFSSSPLITAMMNSCYDYHLICSIVVFTGPHTQSLEKFSQVTSRNNL